MYLESSLKFILTGKQYKNMAMRYIDGKYLGKGQKTKTHQQQKTTLYNSKPSWNESNFDGFRKDVTWENGAEEEKNNESIKIMGTRVLPLDIGRFSGFIEAWIFIS